MSKPKTKGRRYQWDKWFGRSSTKLYRGMDYNGTTTYFAQYIRRAAKRYGYSISIVIGESHIMINVLGKGIEHPEVHTNKYRKSKPIEGKT